MLSQHYTKFFTSFARNIRKANASPFDAVTKLPAIGSQQSRNTHVVKHYKPQELLDWKPDTFEIPSRTHTLSDPKYIYEEVSNTDCDKDDPIKVLLLSTVSGLGNKGDVVSVKPTKARRHLLLPKLAVYATAENLERYKDLKTASDESQPSSFHATFTVNHLAGALIWVHMNLTEKWEIERWHVKVALRRAGIICTEEAIELPSEPIRGPNFENNLKQFYVTVTVNNKEKVRVRCLLNHVTADLTKKLPNIEIDTKELQEPLLPEQAKYLAALHVQRLPLTPSTSVEKQITPEEVEKMTS